MTPVPRPPVDRPACEGGPPVRSQPLPFHRPSIGPAEEAAVVEVLRSGWLTRGPRVSEFEARLRDLTGAPRALALNSCTAALELALLISGIRPGDEVITSSLTFAATANIVVHLGAVPVLVDVEPDTLNIDPERVREAISPRTRAIIAVDLAGHAAEYSALRSLADSRGIPLIADSAHALEAHYRGRPVATLADFTCLSFYANKNLTTGEGGALLARQDDERMDRAEVLSLHGMSRHAWSRFGSAGFRHYDITEAGYKWNMFDLQAALGLAQLPRLQSHLQARAERVALYESGLHDHPAVELLARRPHVRHAHHLFMVKLRLEALRVDRDQVLEALKADGIGCAVHYLPLPGMTFYRQSLGLDPEACPVSRDAGTRLLSLPLFPDMSEADVNDAVRALRRILDFYSS